MTREVYLVRHARCEKSGTLLGQADVALTAEGIAQAQALADWFASRGVERVISSDLRRAVETASRIAEPLEITLEVDARLREISYGDWDGRTWEEIEKADPAAARRKLQDWNGWTPPGGEPFAQFIARVTAAWESIRASSAKVTVVVAHRGVNAVLLGDLMGFQQDYTTARRLTL